MTDTERKIIEWCELRVRIPSGIPGRPTMEGLRMLLSQREKEYAAELLQRGKGATA